MLFYIPVADSLYNWRLITLNPLHQFYYRSPQHPNFSYILCAYKVLFIFNFWLCWVFVAAKVFL